MLGVALGYAGSRAAVLTLPAALPRASEVALDWRVLLVAAALSLLSGILFGLSPALRTSRVNLVDAIKEGGRVVRGGTRRLHAALVAGEIALAMVLLVGAGLMLRTFVALWRVNPGFDPSHAITFSISLPATPNTSSAETRARLRELQRTIQAVPAVEAVSVTLGSRPMIHDSTMPFWIEGHAKPANRNDMPPAMFYLAEAGFQRAMGITLLRGRFLGTQDDEHSPIVIDIDDVFARKYFPGQNPIGKRINLAEFEVQAEVVGIVGHVKQWGPDGDKKSPIDAQFFYPFMQLPEKIMPLVASGVAVVVRAHGDPSAVMAGLRQAVKGMDRRQVIYNVQTMEEVWASSIAARRVAMVLLGIFAALAMLLACIGIYGVISYLVQQRTQEIGVRMALGAQGGDVLRLILGEGARMACCGASIGIAAALMLARFMTSQLFGVSAHDPLTFASVALLLIAVAVAACYFPARRAARLAPTAALRYE